ncbi:hypothetical protein BGX33_010586 [Mortierella sp. NVP41]|nr:hypothetical protein BGX33_010586 [Mortierella sp. NVP41]
MNKLVELDLDLDLDLERGVDDIPSCPYFMPLARVTTLGFAQTCRMFQWSEHLVKVKVQKFRIQNRQEFKFLVRTVTSLPKLGELVLTRYIGIERRRIWDGFAAWSDLFFMCQPSIRKLEVDVRLDSVRAGDAGRSSQNVGGGELEGPWRQDPLVHLTDLVFPHTETGSRGTIMEGVKRALEHFPRLESLDLDGLEPVFHRHDFARTIATCCPLLRKVSFGSFALPEEGYRFPCDLMAMIQAQQVEEFRWTFSRTALLGLEATSMFLRHSKSLRKVVFGMFSMFSSEALCAALLVCEALEEFRMEWPGQRRLVTNPLIFISLGDAELARPWACTKIRHLEVAFGIAASSPLLRPSDNPYYNRLPGCILSVEEQEQLGMLERLYRQIGTLTQLSYLDLRMLALNEQGFPTVTPCGQNIFPALLSLGDGETGRPGYLAL